MPKFDFDSCLAIEPEIFTFKGQEYEVRQADAGAAESYRDAQISGAEFGSDGKLKRINGLAQGESLLVSLCTFRVVRNHETKEIKSYSKINQEMVRSWPEKMVRELADWIKDVSNLHEKGNVLTEKFKAAMGLTASPVSFEDFQKFVIQQGDGVDKEIREIFRPSEEEQAKN